MKYRYMAFALLVIPNLFYGMETDRQHDKHQHEKHPPHHSHDRVKITKPDGPGVQTQVYSCNLVAGLNICRQYLIAVDAQDTYQELKEGCESMPQGKFAPVACPNEALVGKCQDIVRNYHKPDVIYDNYYFGGERSRWSNEEIKRVCKDLGGEFFSE